MRQNQIRWIEESKEDEKIFEYNNKTKFKGIASMGPSKNYVTPRGGEGLMILLHTVM